MNRNSLAGQRGRLYRNAHHLSSVTFFAQACRMPKCALMLQQMAYRGSRGVGRVMYPRELQ